MREVALETVLEVLIDHRGKTPKKLGGDFTSVGVPAISAIHIKNGRINWDQRYRYVSEEMFQRWMPEKTKRGDVLLTSEAPLGEVAQVTDNSPLVLSQRLFGLRGKEGVLNSTYLRYFLQSEVGQNRLLANESGSTVSGIRQALLRQVLVPLPPFPEQQRIAGVLGAFDDLIETNQDLIRLLDSSAVESARALSHGSGRTITTFGEVCMVGGGSTPSTKVESFWGGDHPWATPRDITALPSPFIFDTPRKLTDAGLAKCTSPLRPIGSILMTSRATIGEFALTQVPVAVNQGFIVVNGHLPRDTTWLYFEMRRRVAEFKTIAASGSTFPEISKSEFRTMPLHWPDEAVREKLHALVSPLLRAAASLQQEVSDLTRQRNELLPLLISGKARVSELEGAV